MLKKFCNTHSLAAVLVPAVLALAGTNASAGNVGLDLNIRLGTPPPPPPVVVPVPAPPTRVIISEPAPPALVIAEDDIAFVYPAQLGFYVAVGVPYDLFYAGNSYYLFREGRWFRASDSHGPWFVTRRRELPPGLRRHDIERIRYYRSAEYDIYCRDREHYRGRHFMTARQERKEQRQEEKERWKEARREEKEYQKDLKRAEKEEWKAEKEEGKHRRGWKHDND